MTKARFWEQGFSIIGHSTKDAKDDEGRLVCAAVSSAAYMAANTVTEVIKDNAKIDVKDGEMFLSVKNPSAETKAVLEGLKLHLIELSKQ